MRKADIVLIVLAVLAVWATLAGALAGDRWTDERTVRFTTSEAFLGPIGPASTAGGGALLNWTVPANSTSAHLQVLVTFSGQAVQGGTATVTLRLTTPDGKTHPPITQVWAIAQGATTGSVELNATVAWHEVPGTLRDTSESAHGVDWSQPLVLQVIVEPPADVPVASYAFEAAANGKAMTYAAA